MTSDLAPPIFGLPGENFEPSISAAPQSAGHSFSNLSLVQPQVQRTLNQSGDHEDRAGQSADQAMRVEELHEEIESTVPQVARRGQSGPHHYMQRAELPETARHDRSIVATAYAQVGGRNNIQQNAGNPAVQQMLQAGLMQAKISVSQPSDPLEKEADRVADQVMRTPDPTVRQCEDCAPDAPCPKCEGEKIQRKACSGHSSDVPATLSSSIGSLHGGGQPLPASTRAFFEPRLGFDFSQVRVHTDQKAADSARAIQARAFTVGQEITFAAEQFAPETEEGKRLLAHELTHVVQQADGRESGTTNGHVVARAVDPSKAEPLRKELDSTLYVNNSTLEELWASLGLDLIEAVNDNRPLTSDTGKNKKKESYRDLWWRSTLEQNINVTAASRPVLTAFATDTVELAKSHLQSQHTKLENLIQELKNAAEQKAQIVSSAPTKSNSPEDSNKGLTKNTAEKPIASALGLVDTATFVHFLQNWEEMLKSAPIGMRRVDTSNLLPEPGPATTGQPFSPFPNAPTLPGTASAATSGAGLQPILFDPNLTIEKILESPNVDFVDREAFHALKRSFQECSEKRSALKDTVAAMLAEDANLAVLNERKMLGQVSALGGRTDDEAASAIKLVAEQNAGTVKTFLNMLNTPGAVDWKGLRPIHVQLLSGAGGRRNWSGIVERTFIEGYFKREAEAEREAAELQLKINLVVGGLAFIAMLSPAAPLAAAVLGATSAYAAGNLVNSMAQSAAADKKADAMGAGAAAGVVEKDDARRAKDDAEAKKVSGLEILLTVLPFLPGIAKVGARVIGTLGRQARWGQIAAEAQALNATKAEASLSKPLTKRPRATLQQLQEMIANSSEYYTHRNLDYDVVANQTIRFMGESLPTARKGVYVVQGVKGVPYGKYAVCIKGAKFRIWGVTGRAEEFVIDGEIPVEEGVWYTSEDYAAARGAGKKL